MTEPAAPAPDRGHARTASILLALAEIPWIVVAVQQIGGAHPPLGVWNLFVAGVGVVIAAAVFFAHPLAWTPALVSAYYTIGFSALWAAREGEKILWTSAVAAAGAVAFIGAARPRPAPAPSPSPAAPAAGDGRPDTVVLWAKENLEAIVVAFIMALVIRCFCIEVFKIPSSSMEPTLLGDAALERRTDGERTAEHNNSRCTFEDEHVASSGDRIMVTKYYYAFADLERFDVVVFKFPLNQSRNFIKRVVGLPGETIRVHDGNIFVRGADGRFRIARRTPRTQSSVWIPLQNGSGRDFHNVWLVESGTRDNLDLSDEARIGAVRPTVLRYKEPVGDMRSGGTRVDDLRLAFDLEITRPKGELFAEIANDYGRFELRLATDGESRLLWFDSFGQTAQPKETAPLKARLEMDRRVKVDLWVQDGLAQAWIDGRPAGRIEFIKVREDAEPVPDARQSIRFGSRDLTFRAENLRVGRDIHYIGKENVPEDAPVEVKPGHFVVMGDNVNHSHDSRSWRARTFRLKDGRTVRAENQAINGTELTASQLQDRWGLRELPNYAVAGDEQGRTWALYHDDPGPVPPDAFVGVIDEELESKPMWQIDRKFLVGKALWIWWPQGRWFRLIR